MSLSYEFYAPPNVSGISPASGSLQGGTTVTVTGSGFDAMGAAHCAFGSLTVGDEKMVAGALVPATTIDAHTLECDAPTADRADAVGTAVFNFNEMPPYEVVRPCDFDTCVTPPVRRFRFDTGHNVTLLGDAFHETRQQSLLSGVIKLTENLFLLRGSMVISLYTPGHAAGTPVRAFEASWTHYIGRGNGADGYSFCFGDLRDEDGGELLYAFDEMGHGDGLQVTAPAHARGPRLTPSTPTTLHLTPLRPSVSLQVRFRTYAHFDDPDLNLNRGYGLIEVAYNGSVVNSTFMGSKMRGGIDMDPKAIVVRYDDGGLTVTHDGELVIADQIPRVGSDDGLAVWVGRADGRPQGQPLDRRCARVVGLPPRHRRRRTVVTLNNGSDVSSLAPPAGYTYTADPAVFSFSPTTGPTDGNTTVVLKGSMLAGGSDSSLPLRRRGDDGRCDVRTRRGGAHVCLTASTPGCSPAPTAAPRWWRSRCRSTTVTTRAPACRGASTYRPTSTTPARPDRCARRPAPPPPPPLPLVSPHAPPAAATRLRRASARSSPSSVPTSAAETTTSRASSRRPR